ncbi:hypothetical protein PB01_05180 [Psychrobacillus glaciei]|uniref:Uncharacterized protein n=1 Tax=Psychrobacillus glaciei TaxID=2283160 RepID=A0A5J6SK66_9BACI|nr:hypothetical protein [Psychrobacillus glaciei]QFF98258.1 hypothetical protein PB01_05180 [Psychrobacillus glaciei]
MNSFNDPLLYIKGPPVFHLYPIGSIIQMKTEMEMEVPMDVPKKVQDESTSIYEIRTSMSKKTLAILEKLTFLAKPFQRRAYRPLVFYVTGGVYLQGEVEKVDDEFVTFLVGSEETITYRVDQVEKIVWRGTEMK